MLLLLYNNRTKQTKNNLFVFQKHKYFNKLLRIIWALNGCKLYTFSKQTSGEHQSELITLLRFFTVSGSLWTLNNWSSDKRRYGLTTEKFWLPLIRRSGTQALPLLGTCRLFHLLQNYLQAASAHYAMAKDVCTTCRHIVFYKHLTVIDTNVPSPPPPPLPASSLSL